MYTGTLMSLKPKHNIRTHFSKTTPRGTPAAGSPGTVVRVKETLNKQYLRGYNAFEPRIYEIRRQVRHGNLSDVHGIGGSSTVVALVAEANPHKNGNECIGKL